MKKELSKDEKQKNIIMAWAYIWLALTVALLVLAFMYRGRIASGQKESGADKAPQSQNADGKVVNKGTAQFSVGL